MRALQRKLLWLAGTTGYIGVLVACASQGEPQPEPRPDDDREVVVPTVDVIDGGVADEDVIEGGGPCSPSGLCTVTLPIEDGTILTSIAGSSATDVWVVGSAATVLHFDGTTWEKADHAQPSDAAPSNFTLRSVWLEKPDDVWIADGHSLRHSTGWAGPSQTTWSFSTYAPEDCTPLEIVGRGDVVFVASGPNYCFTGSQVARFKGWPDGGKQGIPTDFSFGAPTALAVSGPDEAWVATSARESATMTANRIRRLSPLGDAGTKWQFEEYESRTDRTLFGMWANEEGLWIVGEGGTIRYLGRAAAPDKRFEIVPSPVVADLRGVFGFGPNDIWAVGDESTVIHWDGTTWTQLQTPFDEAPTKPDFNAVWGSAPGDVWIVGRGAALHYRKEAP